MSANTDGAKNRARPDISGANISGRDMFAPDILAPDIFAPESGGSYSDGPDADRRRSSRFTCGGDAKISRLPSDGIFLPGKILDLSLHGCRVDTTEPIDCGVRAEIVLRVNATSFRAVGEVRAIPSGSGAGIEFVQLSSSGKDVLADLIRELARLQASMWRIKSAPRDSENFRRQLADGEGQARRLSQRFAALGRNLSVGSVDEKSELARVSAAGTEPCVEAKPLVVTVDLFG